MTMPPDERPSDEDKAIIFECGPSTAACKCECGRGGGCEHKWDGPWRMFEDGGSATCARCGMDAMSHDLWCAP